MKKKSPLLSNKTAKEEIYTNLIKQVLRKLDEIPNFIEMSNRAKEIASLTIANNYSEVMIGGAPFFMPVLEKILLKKGIIVHYAFSKRESVDKNIDGNIVKKTVFRHIGFVTKYP